MGVLTRRGAWRATVAAILAAAGLSTIPVAEGRADDDLRRALDATCKARMERLAEVERVNLERVDWEVVAGGVRGVYLGYAPSFTCTQGDQERTPPTARLSYQEVVYEKRGDSAKAARAAAPKPLEIRDVTVVLVYRDGRWW